MTKKQIISTVLALLSVAALSAPAVTVYADTRPIRVALGGADWENSDLGNRVWVPYRPSLTYIDFYDVQPLIINDRVFVPIRPIIEQHQAFWELEWDADTSTATVVSHWGGGGIEQGSISTELIMRPGYASVTRRYDHSGQVTFTATPEVLPQIVDGRFMVPLRTLEYALFAGDVLVWDDDTRTVYILGVAG